VNKKIITLLISMICIYGCAHTAKPAAQDSSSRNYGNLANRVHFPFASQRVYRKERAALASNVQWLRENPEAVVILEGHCDERGTPEYNLALGERRAQSAKDYLVNLGIAASRLSTVSYGEEKPLDMGNNEEAWAKNRRAQFVIE